MKAHHRGFAWFTGALGFAIAAGAWAAVATTQTASLGLTSTRDKGIVSLMTDPVLSDGRLVLKIAAHNPTPSDVMLRASDVKVFTAAGRPVALLSVDELIADLTGARANRGGSQSAASSYGSAAVNRNASGQPDVSSYTGATGSISGGVAPPPQAGTGRGGSADDAQQQQIEAIRAAILQNVTVEPGKAAGGQIVTEKIRFSRKEEKALRVVVDFNGEQHEFNFEAPPAK